MKLLLAYDGRTGEWPLAETARRAIEEEASVTIAAVIPPNARGTKSGGHVGQAPHAREDVERAKTFLRERGIDAQTKILAGDPAERILEEAREGRYDMILTGTRQLGRLSSVVLGSVSRRVVEHAPCPVLVVAESGVQRHEPTERLVA